MKPVNVLLELNVEHKFQSFQFKTLRKKSRNRINFSNFDDEHTSLQTFQKLFRKTRIIQFLNQFIQQINRREQIENHFDAICKNWICVDENCNNFRKFC